jgi:hypothetical protein
MNDKINLSSGMEFAVNSGSNLAKAINCAQKIKALDDESSHNHAGIIVCNKGRTFEALWKIGFSDLDEYKGCNMIIVCHKLMSQRTFDDAFSRIVTFNGKLYPVPRLFLHMVGLAKFVHWKYPVCSELVAKFDYECGFRRNWWGINPDNLVDEWRISKHYEIIFEGIWVGE